MMQSKANASQTQAKRHKRVKRTRRKASVLAQNKGKEGVVTLPAACNTRFSKKNGAQADRLGQVVCNYKVR